MAVVSLHSYMWAFSGCSKRGACTSHCAGFLLVLEHRLYVYRLRYSCSLWALEHELGSCDTWA